MDNDSPRKYEITVEKGKVRQYKIRFHLFCKENATDTEVSFLTEFLRVFCDVNKSFFKMVLMLKFKMVAPLFLLILMILSKILFVKSQKGPEMNFGKFIFFKKI